MSRRSLAVALALAGVLAGAASGCHEETVTSPALSAGGSAQPASGGAPLTVSFALTVAGAVGPFQVAVSYGDGQSGARPDQPHTYGATGTYTAAFDVTTATQSARCSTLVTVAPSASSSPSPSPNQPPVPVFKSVPAATGTSLVGRAPFSVRWNMCATSDPDSDLLWFLYDFDGDGRFDQQGTTGANCRTDHVYASGTWYTKLCLHDVDAAYAQLHANQCRIYTVTVTP
jgi:hypothetical protein